MRHSHTTVYPTLPVDSDRIKRLRTQCQKPREQEEIWSWFILRRISIYVTVGLQRADVKPNTISWLSVCLFLVTGAILIVGEPWAYVLAVVCYNLAYLCDCVDGELARLTGVTSRRGFFIDTLIRAANIPIVIAFGLSLATSDNSFTNQHITYPLALGVYVTATIAAFSLLIPLAYELTYANRAGIDPVGAMRTTSRKREWLAFWTGMPGIFALLLPTALFEWVIRVSIVPPVVTIFLVTLLLKTGVRLYITYKHVNE